jgi:hypothetical protein
MALSRKHQRELNRLKSQAEDLWDDQREVLEHAAKVVREAGRQASRYASEDVAPRVRDTYEDRVRPAFEDGMRLARSTARSAGDRFSHDVVPAVTGALGSALAAIEVARNREVRAAIKNAGRLGTDVGTKLGLVKSKPSFGPGRYILIGIGVVALAGIAYAAWQTLRADDDLWVDDEPAPSQDFDDAEA